MALASPPAADAEADVWSPYLLDLSRAFCISRAFSTAVNLELFTRLGQLCSSGGSSGASEEQIAAATGMKAGGGFRGTRDFLDLLVSIGLITRQGEGADAKFSNSPASERFLVSTSPDFIGGLMLLNHSRTWHQYTHLEHSLRTGRLAEQARAAMLDPVALFRGTDGSAAESFALGMTGASRVAFQRFAAKMDFSALGLTSLGDFGGSAACLSVCVAQSHPCMRCTSYDLTAVRSAAEQYVLAHGMQDRVQLQDLDFFAEDFPKHDVITMSMILHDWGIEKKKMLIKKAYDALPVGGAFVAIDCIIDDARRAATMGFAMSLTMLLEFEEENAFDYSFKAALKQWHLWHSLAYSLYHDGLLNQEFQQWTSEVGFTRHDLLHLAGATSAAIAYK